MTMLSMRITLVCSFALVARGDPCTTCINSLLGSIANGCSCGRYSCCPSQDKRNSNERNGKEKRSCCCLPCDCARELWGCLSKGLDALCDSVRRDNPLCWLERVNDNKTEQELKTKPKKGDFREGDAFCGSIVANCQYTDDEYQKLQVLYTKEKHGYNEDRNCLKGWACYLCCTPCFLISPFWRCFCPEWETWDQPFCCKQERNLARCAVCCCEEENAENAQCCPCVSKTAVWGFFFLIIGVVCMALVVFSYWLPNVLPDIPVVSDVIEGISGGDVETGETQNGMTDYQTGLLALGVICYSCGWRCCWIRRREHTFGNGI